MARKAVLATEIRRSQGRSLEGIVDRVQHQEEHMTAIGTAPSMSYVTAGNGTVTLDSTSTDVENKYKYSEECEDLPPCDAQLSISSGYIQTHEWRQAIDNFNKLFLCGCPEIKNSPEDIYKWLGYSYRNLQLYDSAAFVFKQGLKYTPEDIDLLIWAGENSGKMDNIGDQIYYLLHQTLSAYLC